MVGDVVFELDGGISGDTCNSDSRDCETAQTSVVMVGFENHAGRTYLGSGVHPLGYVIRGFGNNGCDGTEGVHDRNIFGTYCHGPILPKNPALTDLILRSALLRKYGSCELAPLCDEEEFRARKTALRRALHRKPGRDNRIEIDRK